MTILDISIGGAQIETAFALQLDSLHDFRLSLGDRSVVVKGRIAHCHIGELTDVAACTDRRRVRRAVRPRPQRHRRFRAAPRNTRVVAPSSTARSPGRREQDFAGAAGPKAVDRKHAIGLGSSGSHPLISGTDAHCTSRIDTIRSPSPGRSRTARHMPADRIGTSGISSTASLVSRTPPGFSIAATEASASVCSNVS